MLPGVLPSRSIHPPYPQRFRGNVDKQYAEVFDGSQGYGSMQRYDYESLNPRLGRPFIVRSGTPDPHVLQVLGDTLQPGDPILELGCNNGNNLIPLARKGFKLYGVDLAPRRLREIRQLAREEGLERQIKLAHWDFAENGTLPWLEMRGKFKGLIAAHVFPHLSDQRLIDAMQQLKRYLAPGATAVVSVIRKDLPNLPETEESRTTTPCPKQCITGRVHHSQQTVTEAFQGFHPDPANSRPFTEDETLYPGLEDVRKRLHWYAFKKDATLPPQPPQPLPPAEPARISLRDRLLLLTHRLTGGAPS